MAVSTIKEFLRPARPIIGPVFGISAPLVRYIVRSPASARYKRLFWELLGDQLSRASWSFTTHSMYGFALHGNTTDLLGRYVYYFGIWEPNLSNWIARRLSPGDTFVDVGSNIGYYSLLASQLVGSSGHVVAIEASPRIFANLQRNLQLNKADNVRAINIAVSDREGELQLYDGPVGNSGKTSVLEQAGLTRAGTIGARPLTAVLTDDELKSARLIKIDVEGAEWLVVSGFAAALPRTRQDVEFVVEISPNRLASFDRTAEDVLEIFGKAGFNAYQITHDYSSGSYVSASPYQPPRRVEGKITDETDIVFSRSDRAAL